MRSQVFKKPGLSEARPFRSRVSESQGLKSRRFAEGDLIEKDFIKTERDQFYGREKGNPASRRGHEAGRV